MRRTVFKVVQTVTYTLGKDQIKNECGQPILWVNVFGKFDVKGLRGEPYT
mgnify:CR=1 FL=1